MAKYIESERLKVFLRNSIEMLRSTEPTNEITKIVGERHIETYNELLEFIESIEQDQPPLSKESVSKDFEQAAVEAFKQIADSDKNSFIEFKTGAQWQRNHVWHDASEDPDETSLILLALKDGSFIVADENTPYLVTLVDKWCYISDILPTKSE